jgi:tight adherence protein B
MTRHGVLRRALLPLLAGLSLLLVGGVSLPAYADDGSIDHVEDKGGTLQVLYSVPGAGTQAPDLSSLQVTLAGKKLAASAQPASSGKVRRTTILAIDTSNSMAGPKFRAAKQAAQIFLDSVPDDVHVGIVTFAGQVRVLQRPSLHRAASRRLVRHLTLSYGTHLYDGLVTATRTSGRSGPRSVLVLSDGRDTSQTTMATATDAIKRRDVKVDVIALAQSARDESLLTPLSTAGGGQVISAADPKALAQIFTSEAQALASQVLVTARVPAGVTTEGTLAIGLDVGSASYTDSAFVSLAGTAPARTRKTPATTELQPASQGLQLTSSQMLAGVLGLGAGLLVLVVAMFGGLGKQPDSIEERIEAYTARGAPRSAPTQTAGVAASAVGMAQKALEGNHGFEAKLAAKLDSGGLTLKPAEWLLMHAGLALGATALTFALTGGDLLLVVVALGAGVVVPWMYLGRKQSRRLKAFNSQLAGTLQLLAGSLQAGLSVAQGMDTIVREGAEPVAGEFRRALVETRLGVQIEDALESMAERMMSEDFKWTVMAIRIQREVGGNLAELLLTVAATLREREYLRRQVKSLSAEGRFSAYILLALPPLIVLYELTTNGAYLSPLFHDPIGWVMIVAMCGLMSLGAFTMQRLIKLEV